MSQFFRNVNGVVPPGTAIVTVTGDSGGAVGPDAAGNINLFGGSSTVNNDNGITTIGNPGTNTETITLTNRATGQVTTTDATPTTIITFPLGATPGVFYARGNVVAFDITDVAGGAYDFSTGARTTGAAGTELGTEYKDVFEEAAMATADFNIIVSGNNLIVQVVGIAGKTIDWNAELTYRFVS